MKTMTQSNLKKNYIVPPIEGVFKTPHGQYKHLNGKPYLLTGMLNPQTIDYCNYYDTGPLWLVEIEGNVIEAWSDELHAKYEEE